MKTDNFWKIFWVTAGIFLLVGLFGVGWLKFRYLNLPDDSSLALAVGVTFDPSKDPYEKRIREKRVLLLTSGYFYQDSLPLSLENWSWEVQTNWRDDENVFEGSYSAKIKFLEPWSGIRLNNPKIDISSYNSITLYVNPDLDVKDLYIELHDKYGKSMGKQSLEWYTPNLSFTPNTWNKITIPLQNLLGVSAPKEITGVSISSEKTGTVFFDSIQLEKEAYTHSKWEPKTFASGTWIGSDPFTGILQTDLPYSLLFDSNSLSSWRPLFGLFEKVDGGIHIGPVAKKTNGSMSVYGGGKNWSNYRIDAKLYWGMTSTFSLIARFINDSNFITCAYSNYGAMVQIYEVKNGESTMLGQSPQLAIRKYEPWKNVNHGMEVNENRVSCFMDNQKVLSATIPNMSKTGTVGFETWSTNSNDYPHKVEVLMVRPI